MVQVLRDKKFDEFQDVLSKKIEELLQQQNVENVDELKEMLELAKEEIEQKKEEIKKLEEKKPVIFCGDLNVAHKEIDLKNPKANQGSH